MNTTSKIDRATKSQLNRLDAITWGFANMNIILLSQSLLNGVAVGLILHTAMLDWGAWAIAAGYGLGLCGGLILYVVMVRAMQTIIANLVTLTGEPARVRNNKGQFVRVQAVVNKGKRAYVEV